MTPRAKYFNKNEFDIDENKHAAETRFLIHGIEHRFVLTQTQRETKKWPMA